MRNSTLNTLAALALAGGLLASGNLVVQAVAAPATQPTTALLQRLATPAEDSPRFNCKRHGNRQCGVAVDVTPNNTSHEVQRFVITFNKAGQPVAVKPFGR